MSQNHLVDPTWFYDAIEEFAFNYDWYATTGIEVDDHFRQVASFDKRTIRGSLQTQGSKVEYKKEGSTNSVTYEFYCKSLYRINIGDFIIYKHRALVVDSIKDYDEYGVRSATLTAVNIADYQDFSEYLKYINGEIIV